MALASKGKLLADRYRVLGRLGAGGMAVVVLAEDERLGRKVAVKRLHAESPDDAARRFEREAKLGASLNHPNIVAVYDTLADEEGVLIVMEYVEGRTLRQEMDGGPLEPARAIEVLCGMAAGLDHAHEHGVVHRDVKPANVLIAERDGAVKLTDLGIATAAERTNITGSGVVLGTASYMAPERLDGQSGGPPVDIYATAAVAFEALSGQKAVTGKTAMELARRVISQPPPDLAEVVPGTPARAAAVLMRGLAKDPTERPATAGELVRELSGAYAEAAQAGRTRATAALVEPDPAPEPEPEPQPQPEPQPEPRTRPRAAPTPRPAPAPAPARTEPPRPLPSRSSSSRRGLLVPAALAAAALAVVAILLLSSGSGGGNDSSNSQAGRGSSTTGSDGSGASGGGSSTTGQGQGSSGATPAPPAGDGGAAGGAGGSTPATTTGTDSPTGSLGTFYTRAANDDFGAAWALGTDRLHAQFKSLGAFRGTFRTLESISFPELAVKSQSGNGAVVSFRSVAKHTDHTDHCTAQASMVRTGSKWMVDHLDTVDCTSSTGG